ncbi:MAG: class I SAM-dependent methyltransferase [Oligoflexus sp.]|nr:class I SAM-dependent methyltransferase [Oligoflexus sp.]
MIRSDISIGTDDVAAHYDSLDKFYREIWGEHVHHGYWESGRESADEAVLHLSHFLARWLKLSSGDNVVDVGCGYGGTSRLLAEDYHVNVTGFTLSKEQERFASMKNVGNGSVNIVCQDFLSNDLRTSGYDGVLSIECLEHIDDKQEAFNEIHRILKPGKRMAIAVWSAAEVPNRLQTHLLQSICREGRLPSLPSGSEYEALIQGAGLKLVKSREIGDQVKKTWMICAKRLAGKIANDSTYRSYLMNSQAKDRIFALTLVRILAAFEMKAMKYWLFAAEKPA